MSAHRFILEKYKTRKSRYTCPGCSKPFQFTRYVNQGSNEHINEKVGMCNRVEKCGYHYTPAQYFKDHQISTPADLQWTIKPQIELPPGAIPYNLFNSTLKAYDQNNLVSFFASRFGADITTELIARYKIGTSRHWPGATIFWQLDEANRVRTGKVMLYHTETGKRVKEPFSHIHWAHAILKLDGFNLVQCLFGQHLINIDKNSPVAIVESEKTAMICSVYLRDFVWLAAGSLSNLTRAKLNPIKSRQIILFPDTSINGEAFKRWQMIREGLSGFNCVISDLLENKASLEEKECGADLADYLLKYSPSEFVSADKVLTRNQIILGSMIERNQSIKKLIDRFDLDFDPYNVKTC